MGPVFDTLTQEQIEGIIDTEMKDELESGVQVIQYQINTLMTTNGQAPFVTLFLNIKPGDAYEAEHLTVIDLSHLLSADIVRIHSLAGAFCSKVGDIIIFTAGKIVVFRQISERWIFYYLPWIYRHI